MPTLSREEQGIALPSFISTAPTIATGKVTYRLLGFRRSRDFLEFHYIVTAK